MQSSSVQTTPTPVARMAWIDQLRTLAIVLVVNLHACVTYSHVGSWYVQEAPEPPLVQKLMFAFWELHLQSFFMGILFFIAGYFAEGSLARRGPGGFVRERLFRLGIPTLLYMAVIDPLIVFVINPQGDDHGPLGRAYLHYFTGGWFIDGTGPMWFAAALLFFCLALAAWRTLRGRPGEAVVATGRPGMAALGAWALVLVAASFLVRVAAPVGASFHNMQLCYFPQYVLAFGAGLAAARGAWLQALARSPLARRAGWAALVLGPLVLAALLVAVGVLKGKGSDSIRGGWRLPALGFAAWEQLTGLGLALGALAFCSGKLDQATPLSRWLSERSFGVYLFHPPVLILLAIALRPVGIDPFFKVSILTAAGLAGAFLVADIARRVPGLRAIT